MLTYSRYVCVCVEFIIRCQENVILECFVRATAAEERGRRVDDVNTDCKRIHRRVNLQSSVTSSTTQTPARALAALHRATCYLRHQRDTPARIIFATSGSSAHCCYSHFMHVVAENSFLHVSRWQSKFHLCVAMTRLLHAFVSCI